MLLRLWSSLTYFLYQTAENIVVPTINNDRRNDNSFDFFFFNYFKSYPGEAKTQTTSVRGISTLNNIIL